MQLVILLILQKKVLIQLSLIDASQIFHNILLLFLRRRTTIIKVCYEFLRKTFLLKHYNIFIN